MEVRVFVFLLKHAKRLSCLFLVLTIALVAGPVFAAEAEQQAEDKKASEAPLQDEQLLTPKVKRNKIKVGKIDTEDFEMGMFGGLYSIEDFGSNIVVGVRIAYHVSESFFFEGTFGQTKGNKTAAETLLNRDFLTEEDRELTYYNVLFGYNFLPGEAFIGDSWAFINALYLVAGAGNTSFAGEDRFTVTGGFGYRFLATDWMGVHIDFRDHMFETDLFGEEKTTHNMAYHVGFTIFF